MVFSSITFLFIFLPAILLLYHSLTFRFRNFLLLIASLFFYAWGEGRYVLVMLFSIALNYIIGILLNKSKTSKTRRICLFIGVAVNLLLLCYFKYTNWFISMLPEVLPFLKTAEMNSSKIHLPIGISFFTFQAMSYIMDIYRGETSYQKSVFKLGLYISLFPQLIAGPIVRYNQIVERLESRPYNFTLFASGVERFVFGLSKKVILANPMAKMADLIFAQNYACLTPATAWLGIICYTFQIYYDFSGYSDMAIGLGRMFGFKFPENFNFPYTARSIQEFWRRWHISLSTWFRDYLYFPLGGNKKGVFKTYRNLLIVFVLCGLWHGASWNFILWGLIHGVFLALERKALKNWIAKRSNFARHFYTLFIVVHAWVYFRIEDIAEAEKYFKAMYFMANYPDKIKNAAIMININKIFIITLILCFLLSTPIVEKFECCWKGRLLGRSERFTLRVANDVIKPLILFGLFYISISSLSVNSYNPFIYFRF